MKSKKSRLIGIIVGSALVVLAVFLTFNSEDKKEFKSQTKKQKEVIELQQEQDTSEQEFVYELEIKPSFAQ